MSDIAIFDQEGLSVSLIEDKESQTVWATQKQIAEIFGRDRSVITKHIKDILDTQELDNSVCAKIAHTGTDGKTYKVEHYNLDMIIAVGYRVNSKQATKFRQWSTNIIREFALHGAVIDPNRVDAEEIAKQLRKLRVEEKHFYNRIRDVFKTAATDYDKDSPETRRFFSMVSDKFMHAITSKVSARIILDRADASKPNMGLKNFTGVNYPTVVDITTGKNYLEKDELEELEILCENFLGFCQLKAFKGQTMTFEEITHKVNSFLEFNGYKVLYQYDQPLRKKADTHAKEQQRIFKENLKIESKSK